MRTHVGVVVGRIAIDKLVEEEGVEGEAPIAWRWVVGVVQPCASIIERISGGLVLIKIIAQLLGIIDERDAGKGGG